MEQVLWQAANYDVVLPQYSNRRQAAYHMALLVQEYQAWQQLSCHSRQHRLRDNFHLCVQRDTSTVF